MVWSSIAREERGQTSVEYGMVLLFVAIALTFALIAVNGPFEGTVDAILGIFPA